MSARHLNLAAIVAVATSSLAVAQLNGVNAGLGRQTRDRLDLETLTTNVQALGVAYLNGLAYVSCRGNAGGVTDPPHSIYVIEPISGTLIQDCQQDTDVQSQVWGFRDGATDGTSLMFGNDNGIYVSDPATIASGVDIGRATQVMADNGPQLLNANPIAGPGLALVNNNYRGVAYDPSGNGGNGSFWTGNFGSDLIEIDLDGNVLTSWPVNGWSIYGLALDPQSGMLWCNSAPTNGELAEIDITTGTLTGRTIPKEVAGAVQGGIDIVPGGLDGRNCGNDLLVIDQGSATSPGLFDTLAAYRLNQWNNVAYPNEPRLQVGFDGGLTADPTNVRAVIGSVSTIDWDLDMPGVTYAAFLNFEPQSLTTRPVGGILPGLLNSLWEFRRDLSTGPIINGVSGAPLSVNPGALGMGKIAAQAVYIDFNVIDPNCGVGLGLGVSNERCWTFEPSNIRVQANGANSFNSDTTSGFFSVANNIGQDITSVSFSFFGSSQPGKEFDTDQGAMADQFDAGLSTLTGCGNTYRNGSDAATGLDYGAGGIPLGPTACDPIVPTGWLGTDPIGTAGDVQTLTFAFTDFNTNETFEFDCDTDGTGGTNGSGMDGMIVTITLADTTVLMGTLVADPADANLAEIVF